jgi:hypothetical protein
MQSTAEEKPYVTTGAEPTASEVSSVSTTEVDIDESRLVRRIDFRVMPMLFLIYIAAFLDR